MSELNLDELEQQAMDAIRSWSLVACRDVAMQALDLCARVRELEAELVEVRTSISMSRQDACEMFYRRGKKDERERQNKIMRCGHPRSAVRWTGWPNVGPAGEHNTTCWCAECHAAGDAERDERERCLGIIQRFIDAEWGGYTSNRLGLIRREIEAASPSCPSCCEPLADGTDTATAGGVTRHCRCLR